MREESTAGTPPWAGTGEGPGAAVLEPAGVVTLFATTAALAWAVAIGTAWVTGLRDDRRVVQALVARLTGRGPTDVSDRVAEQVEGVGAVLLGLAYFGVPVVLAPPAGFGPADSVLQGGRPSVAYTAGFVAVAWLAVVAAAAWVARDAVTATTPVQFAVELSVFAATARFGGWVLVEEFGAPVAFDPVDAGTVLLVCGVVLLATVNRLVGGRWGVPTPGDEEYAAAVFGLGALLVAAGLWAGPLAHAAAAGGVLAGVTLAVLGALSATATVE